MERKEIAAVVESAIAELLDRQPELLALDINERTLSHHLASYIRQRVPSDLHVDVEYNRHGINPKRLQLPPRQALDREIHATTVFPDILVHKRNTNIRNILVLEVKKPGVDMAYDQIKLRAFRRELGYMHTAHVVLGIDTEGATVREVIWVDD